MKTIKVLFLIILLPYLSISQSLPEELVGEWYVERYENFKTGKISYVGQKEYRILKVIFTPTTIYAETCNGIHCNYTIQEGRLHLTCSGGTYIGCSGWKGLLEEIFKYGKQYKIKVNRGILDIEVENEFLLTLYK
jgi:hypothetical protein